MLAWTLILTLQESPDVVPVPAPADPHSCWSWNLRAGLGAWGLGGFKAATPLGAREVENDLLLEGSVEATADRHGWEIGAGVAFSGGDDLGSVLGWLRFSPPPLLDIEGPLPLQFRVSGGLLAGSIQVEESAFGDFESAIGYLARLSIETPSRSGLGFALAADLRGISFDYEEPVLSGDDVLGGFTFALGLSVLVRF